MPAIDDVVIQLFLFDILVMLILILDLLYFLFYLLSIESIL